MGQKILIVEDDLPVIEAISFKLNKAGLHADTALNGDEAMKRIRREKYDLILLDLLLPKKNGFEVIKEVKADKILAKTKIIAFTNLGSEDDSKKAMILGADDYFVKADTKIEDIIKKILKLLNNTQNDFKNPKRNNSK